MFSTTTPKSISLGWDPDTCLLKSSRRPSDLPRLRDCRRLDCFPGWFRRWPCAVAGRLPLQGQADVEELKPDLGLTPVPPPHASGTPKRDAGIPRQEQSRWPPALAVGPKAAPPKQAPAASALAWGPPVREQQAADLASARRRPRAPSPLQRGPQARSLPEILEERIMAPGLGAGSRRSVNLGRGLRA